MSRKLAALLLIIAAILGLVPGAAIADPDCTCSAALSQRIADIDRRAVELPKRESEIDSRQKALDSRVATYNQQSKDVLAQLSANDKKIADHNARVAGYPNGAPRGIANALNAEAAALNAEQARLKAQANAIANDGVTIKSEQRALRSQKDALDAERAKLARERQEVLRQMAEIVEAAVERARPAVQRAAGGDLARPPSRAQHTPDAAGGDPVTRRAKVSALDGYARKHSVAVDKQQVTAYLSSAAVSQLSPSQAANLQLRRTFDGLVRKPDGNYKALYATPPGWTASSGQKAFADAVARGGPAIAVVNGKKIVINEIEQVHETPRFAVDSKGTITDLDGPDAQILLNKMAGDAFRNDVAAFLRSKGRKVVTDAEDRAALTFKTPYNDRIFDLGVWDKDGVLLGYVEVKKGKSPYTPEQQQKDEWLRQQYGFNIDVIRLVR